MYSLTFSRVMPLLMMPVNSTPMRVPHTVPMPPSMLVPPMTTEEMIWVSQPRPKPKVALRTWAEFITPLSTHISCTMHSTNRRVFHTLMPLRRAASALPPTA